MLLMVGACSHRVDLDPVKIENQFNELTPYWEFLFTKHETKNKNSEIEFTRYYWDARNILLEYNDAARKGTDGTLGPAYKTDAELLWAARWNLNRACKYTNQFAIPNQ